jgi:hypothetical protein
MYDLPNGFLSLYDSRITTSIGYIVAIMGYAVKSETLQKRRKAYVIERQRIGGEAFLCMAVWREGGLRPCEAETNHLYRLIIEVCGALW